MKAVPRVTRPPPPRVSPSQTEPTMKIPVVINVHAASVAWLVLLLAMAAFVGYQSACAVLSTRQLLAASAARERADELMARAAALLQQAEGAQQPEARSQRRNRMSGDADQVSSL